MALDIKEIPGLENVFLDNLIFEKEKQHLLFLLTSPNVIKFGDIDCAKKFIAENYGNKISVEFEIQYNLKTEFDKISFSNLEENIRYYLNKFSTMCKRSAKVIMTGKQIKIEITNKFCYDKIKSENFTERLKDYIFALYKLSFDFDLVLEEVADNAMYDRNDELLKQFEEDAKLSAENIKKNKDKPKDTATFNAKGDASSGNNYKRVSRKYNSSKYDKLLDSLPLTNIRDIDEESGDVNIRGKVVRAESRELRSGKFLLSLDIYDDTDTITCKYFANAEDEANMIAKYKGAQIVGTAEFDNYSKEVCVMIRAKREQDFDESVRDDKSEEKRVELHLHTNMSSLDAMADFNDYASYAKKWGHKALAITDHGVVQGFPFAMKAATDDFKVIYGIEAYMVNDGEDIITGCEGKNLDSETVIFDIETTGFNRQTDDIIEIGAVKIKDRKIVDTFSTFIHIDRPIPEHITELTSITDDMLIGAPNISEALELFKDFVGENGFLVAHNAQFDVSFIKNKMKKNLDIDYDMPVLDTLNLSRSIVTNIKTYKLNSLTKHFKIKLENHHRAVDDARATTEVLLKLYDILETKEIYDFDNANDILKEDIDPRRLPTYHTIILVKNLIGLKELYKLVSKSHLELFYKKPRMLKSDINKIRENLIIGSACEAGELYKAVLNGDKEEKIEKIAGFYDYLEIQPNGNNMFMVRKNIVESVEDLCEINRKIIALGKKMNKLIIATGDVHFRKKEDALYREILMTGQGFGDASDQPPLYFKTTDEMLDDFSYLGEELAREVVITNTNIIADRIEKILPIPDGTFPPIIDGADDDFRNICYEKAHKMYGEILPEIVEERLERELNSIISNGYSIMYIIAQKLVAKSNEDGYIVGSRGSVGSSFAATMSGISEVNPLCPHYICDECQYSEFFTEGEYGSGFDLPDKKCPNCGAELNKDGHEIPFEVFLGFYGDKEPDIDLNFAGEEQGAAMQYTEDLFGEGKVYRAGTIATIADKTAYGYVRKYFDGKGIIKRNAEINRLVGGCTGVKRTTGQHPGGVMVVPRNKDIHDFTPVNYPANKKDSGSITTHFDYHSISGRILKLDLLGHDTPTIIRMFEEMTGISDKDVPLDDAETMSLFNSPKALGVTKDDIECETGTLGIPEFGTNFVRAMVKETKPKCFADLLRISGLSHGTDVWVGNAQELIANGTCELNNVIATRDDIMVYLIAHGVDNKMSFDIMEHVRKGKGLKDDEIAAMKEKDVPEWYIESCQKIKYMFPKAHAVAYVMMSVKIAYFKVHYPKAFYATYFSMKTADFDAAIIALGVDVVERNMELLREKGNSKTAKEGNMLTILEVCREMYKRNIICEKVDLYKSDDKKFQVTENGILPPLCALQGVGETAATSIKEARKDGEFISQEDLLNRTKANKTVIEVLDKHGALKNMDKTNQISIFNL